MRHASWATRSWLWRSESDFSRNIMFGSLFRDSNENRYRPSSCGDYWRICKRIPSVLLTLGICRRKWTGTVHSSLYNPIWFTADDILAKTEMLSSFMRLTVLSVCKTFWRNKRLERCFRCGAHLVIFHFRSHSLQIICIILHYRTMCMPHQIQLAERRQVGPMCYIKIFYINEQLTRYATEVTSSRRKVLLPDITLVRTNEFFSIISHQQIMRVSPFVYSWLIYCSQHYT